MLEFFTLVLFSLFFTVNSLGNLPLFIAMLEKFKESERQSVLRKSTIVAFVTFLVFSFFGKYIFDLMNIEIYSFYIAGGILISIISIGMLLGKRAGAKVSKEEEKELLEKRKEEMENLAITPIAVPMLTGPGAITLGLVYFSSIELASVEGPVLLIEFLLASSLSFFLTFIVISRSEFFRRILGRMGLKVVSKVMGLLLLSIGVQFIVNGFLKIIALL